MKLDQALSSVNKTWYYNVDTLWGIEPRYLSYQEGEFRYNRMERKLQVTNLFAPESINNKPISNESKYF